ncbi:MAG: polysaccharide deacetylase family protein [Gammaproteobacteria bacterium]|nr:polysaccharide deacetylase family protein [Gammaproteobacteria bacterium]
MRAIITFHSIDSTGSVLSFAPKAFADFVCALAESSIPVCDLDTLLDPRTECGFTLTFDDGMASVFTQALPVLKEHRMPAHLFLTTASVGSNNRWPSQPEAAPTFKMLDWGQVEACHAGGFYIEAHTVTHPDLTSLSDGAIESECSGADELINRRLGRQPAYFAYPYGYADARVRRLVAARYRGCVTTRLRPLGSAEDPAALPRIDAFYLRSPLLYRRLNTASVRAYFAIRSLLRTLRGTQ